MVYRYIKPRFGHRETKRSSAKYVLNEYNKTFNDQVYPRIPFLIRSKPYRIKVLSHYGNDPSGQLKGLAFSVTKLVRDERIELNYNKASEIRPHVERLIVEAMRNGDRHRPTMELANFWLIDKQLIHKLFKELVPRYENFNSAFTAMHMLGLDCNYFNTTITEVAQRGKGFMHVNRQNVVLELRGNNLPPIKRPHINKSGLLTNVLLAGARERYQLETKAAIEAAAGAMSQSEETSSASE